MPVLAQIAALFAKLSLLAFGGGSGVLPEMQRVSVDQYHWLSGPAFLQLFAISRAAPGPGSLIVVLIGQRAAGLAGALVALLGMFVPSCLVVYGLAQIWQRARTAPWRARTERALAPLGIGLIYASAVALMRDTEHGLLAYGVTAAASVVMARTSAHPLVVLAGGGLVMLAFGAG